MSNGPTPEAWIKIGLEVDPDDAAKVRAMVERPTQLGEGHRLPAEAKARILQLVDAELSDGAIADQLGISRQAVTGVRSAAARRERLSA